MSYIGDPNSQRGFSQDMQYWMPSAQYLIQALKDRFSAPGRLQAGMEQQQQNKDEELQNVQQAIAKLGPMQAKKLNINGIAGRLASTDRPGDYQ